METLNKRSSGSGSDMLYACKHTGDKPGLSCLLHDLLSPGTPSDLCDEDHLLVKPPVSPSAPGTPLSSVDPKLRTHSSSSTSSNSSSYTDASEQLELLADISNDSATALERCRAVFQDKKILIISGGTRGDVQPATALGVALSGLGARVCLAADASFEGFVQHHGLAYYPLGGDAKEMMAVTVKWGGMLPNEWSGMSWLRGQIKEVMDSVWAAALFWQPDMLLANQLAYGQIHVAEKLQLPLHMIYTIPWLPTKHIAHPWARAWGANITEYANAAAGAVLRPGVWALSVISPKLSHRLHHAVMSRVGAAANWISTPLLDHTAWWGIADLMTAFRHSLGLPWLSTNNTGLALYRLPTLCMFSSCLVPRPSDWGSHVTLAGFLSLNEAVQRFDSSSSSSSSSEVFDDDLDASAASSSDGASSSSSSSSWQPSTDLQQFLAAGSPPIYIGFGSMVVQNAQQLITAVINAVLQLPIQQRVILCTGWSGAAAAAADSSSAATAASEAVHVQGCGCGSSSSHARVFCMSEAPHDWLFPRCLALVHHGGVGTTAVGLRCGKPTLVVPAFGDLYFWGNMCHKMGVGPAPIPLEQLNSRNLLKALQELLDHMHIFTTAAERVAGQLQKEDSLTAAVEAVASVLDCAVA